MMLAVRALAVWFLLLVTAVLNGFLRERFLIPKTGQQTGHILSTISLCALILLLTWPTIAWLDPPSAIAAAGIGVAWLVLTLVFEFGFGHYIAHKPWSELLADYDILHGRIWIFVLFTTAAAPWLTGRLRGVWS